jgi:predicted oxidoreductase
MQVPLQVTFEGTEPSEAVRALIDREVAQLEKHNHRIIGCRVAVIAPSHKHRHVPGSRSISGLQFRLTKTFSSTTRRRRMHGTNMLR